MPTSTLQLHQPLLTEQDLRLFLQEPVPLRQALKPLYLGGAVFLVALAAIYGTFNYNALLRIYDAGGEVAAAETAVPTPPLTQEQLGQAPAVTSWPAPTISTNSVSMPSVNVSAPVAWDVPFDEKLIDSKLPNGVVHFQGTAKPGQKGTVVITGHSSNYPWIKGDYNTVFAPLHKAKVGQTITLNYNDREYTYSVTKIYQVSPKQLEVLQAGEQDGLRLITCTPLGTSLRRLVVEAVQVSPAPSANEAFTHTVFKGSVPGAR